ncbi:MAG: hypothetical protein CMF75_04920 [Maricaulis sp.]|nr:hypothetical protein [Maricaulis sp.]
MLFVTNRRRKGNGGRKAGSKVRFDTGNRSPEVEFFACRFTGGDTHEFLGSNLFFQELRDQPRRNIFLFVHGFNVSMDDALKSAARLQLALDQQLGTDTPAASLVVPFIWPSAGAVLEYWDDQDSAKHSAAAYSRFLNFFVKWRDKGRGDPATDNCDRRINILAHSMGNRVLVYGLRDWAEKNGGTPHLFRNVFMVAPDIVNESLEREKPGRLVSDAARNVVVYHASDDLALRSSKAANVANAIASRRLGHNGPEDMNAIARNVFAADCSDFNNGYEPLGHSYFLRRDYSQTDRDPGVVLRHMAHAVDTGRVAVPDGEISNRLGDGGERRAFVLPESWGR